MSNSITKVPSQMDMKQKLLNILSEKNSRMTRHAKPCSSLDNFSITRKMSQRSHKLPIEMTNFERERWLFEMVSTQDNAKLEQELQEIYVKSSKLISRCRNKEIKWNQKREALQNEIEFLKQLLLQQ